MLRIVFAASSICLVAGCGGEGTIGPAPGERDLPAHATHAESLQAVRAPNLTPGLTVLYSFQAFPDGANPFGGVEIGPAGNIFGTTSSGGANGYGTAFELKVAGSAYSEQVVYDFDASLGSYPYAAPIEDSARNLFVTTSGGGQNRVGAALELSQHNGSYQETSDFPFSGGGIGGAYGPLVSAGGSLYATTIAGGKYGIGAIYKLSPAGLAGEDVYDFSGTPHGSQPITNLVADAAGALYGTTTMGGRHAIGTVFQFTPGGTKGTMRVLWNFAQGDGGSTPAGGVVLDASGNIFGTTERGGASDAGVVYELSPHGKGYVQTVLHTFTGAPDGYLPIAGLTALGENLYGTTAYGGTHCQNGKPPGCGTVFKISTSGIGYSVVHNFMGGDGLLPYYGALFARDGALYGTTSTGGSQNRGVVYRYVPSDR